MNCTVRMLLGIHSSVDPIVISASMNINKSDHEMLRLNNIENMRDMEWKMTTKLRKISIESLFAIQKKS